MKLPCAYNNQISILIIQLCVLYFNGGTRTTKTWRRAAIHTYKQAYERIGLNEREWSNRRASTHTHHVTSRHRRYHQRINYEFQYTAVGGFKVISTSTPAAIAIAIVYNTLSKHTLQNPRLAQNTCMQNERLSYRIWNIAFFDETSRRHSSNYTDLAKAKHLLDFIHKPISYCAITLSNGIFIQHNVPHLHSATCSMA